MINDEFDDADLRYLQCDDFTPGRLQKWTRPANPFTARMAANLRPGFAVQLDLQTLVEVLGGAACNKQNRVINVSLQLQDEYTQMEVCSIEQGMPSICADDAGSLLPALNWYREHDVRRLQVSVMAPSFFWLPQLLARAEADEPTVSDH